jgi:hypothetical protein
MFSRACFIAYLEHLSYFTFIKSHPLSTLISILDLNQRILILYKELFVYEGRCRHEAV